MVPVYAFVSFLSYYFYRHAIYFEVIRDCYEAFAIASFFALLCHYIAPDLHSQKDYFRTLTPKNWVLPINWVQRCAGGRESGFLRRPRSGLTWFNVCSVWLWNVTGADECLGNILRGFSVLLHPCLHDSCCRHNTGSRKILHSVATSGFCAYMGKHHVNQSSKGD